MNDLAANGAARSIVGIVRPKEDAGATFLNSGIYYSYDLTKYIIDNAANSDIVRNQLANPAKNILREKISAKKAQWTLI